MDDSVLYLEYYLILRDKDCKLSHDVALQSVKNLMDDRMPRVDDFQIAVFKANVVRVCNRVNNMLQAAADPEEV